MADLCILYEITNYKDESAEPDFWDMYMDFFELGDDQNFIRALRMDEASLETLDKSKRQEYLNRQSSQITTPMSARNRRVMPN